MSGLANEPPLVEGILREWLADVDDALEDDPSTHDAFIRIGARWEKGNYSARFRAAIGEQ